MKSLIQKLFLVTSISLSLFLLVSAVPVFAQLESGSVGVEGRISAPPPEVGARISVPTNGQTFNSLPVRVSGICPNGLLVKLFKNNVFGGSVQCENGSFSMQIDLFNGENQLIARVYDELDQAGPDSNRVTVTFDDPNSGADNRVTLSSNFAKRGATPGTALKWPIILSGGIGPYAVSIDWGDGKESTLMTREFPGTFDIEHVYDNPGIYNIIVKAVDDNGGTAYLQLVGVGNGPLSQEGLDSGEGGDDATVTQRTRILWQPAAIFIPFLFSTFWLGKKYQMKVLQRRIEKGERPF